jgi:hypothetical protein
MLYQYVCNVCNKSSDVELKFGADLPKDLPCEDVNCKGVRNQDMSSKLKNLTLHVPFDMRAGNFESALKYPKSEVTEARM